MICREQWKFAMSYSLSTVDSTGLMNVSSSADWLRFGMGGKCEYLSSGRILGWLRFSIESLNAPREPPELQLNILMQHRPQHRGKCDIIPYVELWLGVG